MQVLRPHKATPRLPLARRFRLLFKPFHAGERYYRNYDNVLQLGPGALSIYTKLKASLQGKGPVLDFGCGTGYVTEYLGATGIDRSTVALGIARRRFPRTRFMQGDLASLLKPERRWQAVACVNVLEHLEDPDLEFFFSNIGRILKPKGSLHIVYDDMYHPLQLLSGLIHPGMLLTDPTHVHCWTQGRFRRLLQSRFELVHEEGGNILSRGLPWTNRFHSARLYVVRPKRVAE
jgi:SAM-dependent methyltransferase